MNIDLMNLLWTVEPVQNKHHTSYNTLRHTVHSLIPHKFPAAVIAYRQGIYSNTVESIITPDIKLIK